MGTCGLVSYSHSHCSQQIWPEESFVFDFTATPGYAGVERVELVMFNCPEWGIAVQTIIFRAAPSIGASRSSPILTFTVPTFTSCDSLVMICITQNIEQRVIALEFNPPPDSTRAHLAEVTFYGDGSCPPDADTTIGTTMDVLVTTTNCKCWSFLELLCVN